MSELDFGGWLRLQRTAIAAFSRGVDAIGDRWHIETPDEGWDVADLVRHVVDEQIWIPGLLAGNDYALVQASLPPIPADGQLLTDLWHSSSREATDAWQEVKPSARVQLSFGRVKAEAYLRESTGDVAIHAWDLAAALGIDRTIDDELMTAVWDDLRTKESMLRASSLYGDAFDIGPDASSPEPSNEDRVLALTGRNPRWEPNERV